MATVDWFSEPPNTYRYLFSFTGLWWGEGVAVEQKKTGKGRGSKDTLWFTTMQTKPAQRDVNQPGQSASSCLCATINIYRNLDFTDRIKNHPLIGFVRVPL